MGPGAQLRHLRQVRQLHRGGVGSAIFRNWRTSDSRLLKKRPKANFEKSRPRPRHSKSSPPLRISRRENARIFDTFDNSTVGSALLPVPNPAKLVERLHAEPARTFDTFNFFNTCDRRGSGVQISELATHQSTINHQAPWPIVKFKRPTPTPQASPSGDVPSTLCPLRSRVESR